MKFDTKKMDLDALDELIGMCETKMIAPFRKNKTADAKIEAASDETASETSEKPDLSDADTQDLIEMYQDIQGNV